MLEVRFADSLWYHGRPIKRIPGADPPRWWVSFEDGELCDEICLDSMHMPVRFDAGAHSDERYRSRVNRLPLVAMRPGVEFRLTLENVSPAGR